MKQRIFLLILTSNIVLASELTGYKCGSHTEGDSTSSVEESYRLCVRYNKKIFELNSVINKSLQKIEDDSSEIEDRSVLVKWKRNFLEAQDKWVDFVTSDCNSVSFEWWGGQGAGRAVRG